MIDNTCSRRSALARMGIAATAPLLCRQMSAADDIPLANAIDRLLKDRGFNGNLPGLAVLVQQAGQPAVMRCVGLANLKTRAAITPQTMFELASVSKPLTATAVLILNDRDKLTLRDDVRQWIPELPDYDSQNPIRIRDLLQHVSGLEDYMSLEVPAKNQDYWLNSDYVGEFARQNIPLRFPTGEKHEYQNTNYMLLAVVIERVTKMSYGAFMRSAIFEPCHMKTAFVNEGPGSVPERGERVDAIGYVHEDGGWKETWGTPPDRQETLLTVGDGAIWCSLEDMGAWDAAIQGKRLLKPQTMKRALEPSKTRDRKSNDYSFGWSLSHGPRGRLVSFWHGGSWGGFGTFYSHDVQRRRTVVILGNGRDFDRGGSLHDRIAELSDKHGFG